MKKLITAWCVVILVLLSSQKAHAQWGSLGDRVVDGLSNKAQQKIEGEINNGADKAYDKTKESVKNSGKKSKGNNASDNGNNKNDNNGSNNENGNNNGNSSSQNSSGSSSNTSFKSYSKFDFVTGDKVIALEDFSQDAIGDFPDKWNTNGAGEVVTYDGKQGHWFQITKAGICYPEFMTELPDNFTFEFDLICNKDLSYYSSAFNFNFVALTNDKQYTLWGQFPGNWETKINGVRVSLHPQNAGNTAGMSGYKCWENGEIVLQNDNADLNQFYGSSNRNSVHVSVWRQKQRLRVYVNEEKIWDVPKAFQTGVKYNKILFNNDGYNSENDRYSFTNLKLAVGAPDTRNKLITEGKFVTHGILFDVNSANIKPESYGALKDIAAVLTENSTIRVKIIGHTDSDGDDASNMTLSKKRADAVKTALSKNFAIDASRMDIDGKGETQPIGPNTTVEGKANNRRVEFIKL